jgi:hypothetical protein
MTERLDAQQELLDGMKFASYVEANMRLSPRGKEMLNLLDEGDTYWSMSVVDGFKESAGIDRLQDHDYKTLEIYVGRMALIQHVQKDLDEEWKASGVERVLVPDEHELGDEEHKQE